MRQLKTLLAVVGGATILVLAGNTVALATTGHSLILGHSNSADTYTGITRTTSGSVLKLTTKSSTNAPLTVNGKGKIANLNADLVDGYDSSTMRNRTYTYTVPVIAASTGFSATVPLPAGAYTFGYSAFFPTSGTTGNANCQVRKAHASTNTFYGLAEFLETATANPAVSGSGEVTVSSGDTITFECFTATNFTSNPNIPIQIQFTSTGLAANTTLTPGPLP